MKYIYYNNNPHDKLVPDCVVRAIAMFLNESWSTVYIYLTNKGLEIGDLISSNLVWMSFLNDLGYKRYLIPDTCPFCYTVKEFCADHPIGYFLVGTGEHLVCIKDGDYYDTWDSGDEVPLYYWSKGEIANE